MNLALNLVAVKTIIRKEVVRVLRIWIQTIVPPAITMTLYFPIRPTTGWLLTIWSGWYGVRSIG